MAATKQPVSPGTRFVKNRATGVVFDVAETDPICSLAAAGEEGWRFATTAEIRDYCKNNNLEMNP